MEAGVVEAQTLAVAGVEGRDATVVQNVGRAFQQQRAHAANRLPLDLLRLEPGVDRVAWQRDTARGRWRRCCRLHIGDVCGEGLVEVCDLDDGRAEDASRCRA